MTEPLSDPDRRFLLKIARESIAAATSGQPLPALDPAHLSHDLQRLGASFVTLTHHGGELRGCIGGLQAVVPLYQDVQEHAAQAALDDYRFPPVTPDEVPGLEIEISILTPPQPLDYERPGDLPRRLRPHVDGVIIAQGVRRATFLPQVWDKVPDPELFLSMLCEKMGAHPDTWRRTKLDVQIYQVEEFSEAALGVHNA